MDDQLESLRSSMAAAGYDMKKMSASSPPPPSPADDRKGFVRAIVEAFRDAPYPSVDIAVEEIMATFRGDYPATPSSPETPAEVTEALDELESVTWSAAWTHSTDRTARDAARSALLALYTRQREEIEDALEIGSELNQLALKYEDQVKSLSSQLERLKAEHLTISRSSRK